MCWKTITIIICILVASSENDENVGVFEKIKSGFNKMAGNFFSSEHASKVANLVSSALGQAQIKDQYAAPKPVKNNIFSGFFRLFGFDSKKIGAIAVNAIIIVAQLISRSILLRPPSKLEEYKEMKDSSPFDWMLDNSAVADLLENARDEKLSEQVLEQVTERSADEESGCVQLLICKTTPYIKGMQKMLANEGNGGKKSNFSLLRYFPSVEEVSSNADECLKKHHFCYLNL